MPVKIKRLGNKFRVIEANTGRIAKNKAGTAVDGGGHGSKMAALKQAGAINMPKRRKSSGKKATGK